MCMCRTSLSMTLAMGMLVGGLVGQAQAESRDRPVRVPSEGSVPSDPTLTETLPESGMTQRGGGVCDSPALCDGDANGDGSVDPLDTGSILARFGLDPCVDGNCAFDVNCDGAIDPLDTGYVLARFGVCNPPTDCQTPGCTPEPPANDDCEDSIEVFLGDTPFSNVGATRDGPDDCPEADTGDFFTGQADIWFTYRALEDGSVLISLCQDTDYDSTMSIYSGTGCPVGASLLCSDDDCGSLAGPSVITADLNMGDIITIRVGGWSDGTEEANPEGSGTMSIKTSGGPCCLAHTIPGCDEIEKGDAAEVEACVCEPGVGDVSCCEVVWDDFCVILVEQLGCGECPFTTNCCDPTGSAGCNEPTCEGIICNLDPFCCETDWDPICAAEAADCCVDCGGDPSDPDCLPPEACGQFDAGDCCVANGTPGCDDEFCCLTVCPTAGNEFCCDTAWDQGCADTAITLCDICVP